MSLILTQSDLEVVVRLNGSAPMLKFSALRVMCVLSAAEQPPVDQLGTQPDRWRLRWLW